MSSRPVIVDPAAPQQQGHVLTSPPNWVIYKEMTATLIAPNFKVEPSAPVKLVVANQAARAAWTLAPDAQASGDQKVRVEVHRADGSLVIEFDTQVNVPGHSEGFFGAALGAVTTANALIGGLSALVVSVAGAYAVVTRWRQKRQATTGTPPAGPSSSQ